MEYDLKDCYRQSRNVVRHIINIIGRDFLERYEEDLIQMTVISSYRCSEKGLMVTQSFMKRLVYENIGKLFGGSRYNGRRAVFDNEIYILEWWEVKQEEIPGEFYIALWRFQIIWDTLTDIQKKSFSCKMTGGSWVDLSKTTGVSEANLQRSASSVIKKLNGEMAVGKGNGAFVFGRPRIRSGAAAKRDRKNNNERAKRRRTGE